MNDATMFLTTAEHRAAGLPSADEQIERYNKAVAADRAYNAKMLTKYGPTTWERRVAKQIRAWERNGCGVTPAQLAMAAGVEARLTK